MNRKLGYTCVYVIAMYLFVEALSFLCLLSIRKLRGAKYNPIMTTLSAETKVRIREIMTQVRNGKFEHYNPDGLTGWVSAPPDANSAGMRDDRQYDTSPAPGILRIAAFGASFVFADEVPLGETWTKRITAVAPSVEVLNYGVKGYGVDQAYLHYLRDGLTYHPSVVFIAHTADDLEDDVEVYRPFRMGLYPFFFAKPRFQIRNGQLTLLRNPLSTVEDYENFARNDAQVLKELGRNDYNYQNGYHHGRFDFLPSVRLAKISWRVFALRLHGPIYKSDGTYNVRSEAYEVTERVFDAFYRKVLENGALPVIVIFPRSTDLDRGRQGEIPRYAPLLEHFRSKGYRFIDTQNVLEGPHISGQRLFAAQGHYSPLGNQFVAEYVVAQLKGWGLADASKIGEAAQVERRRLAGEGR